MSVEGMAAGRTVPEKPSRTLPAWSWVLQVAGASCVS